MMGTVKNAKGDRELTDRQVDLSRKSGHLKKPVEG
jgi:hypothetical protein